MKIFGNWQLFALTSVRTFLSLSSSGRRALHISCYRHHLEVIRHANLSVPAWDPGVLGAVPEVPQELASGSLSLLLDALSYRCLVLTATAPHSKTSAGWTRAVHRWAAATRHRHTGVCWHGDSWLVFRYGGTWGIRNLDRFHLVYFTLKKKLEPMLRKSHIYLSDSLEHLPHQSHSPGPVPGPAVGKAITPGSLFSDLYIGLQLVFRVSVIYSLILFGKGKLSKKFTIFPSERSQIVIWNQKSQDFT